jgi:N utilization substance protein B
MDVIIMQVALSEIINFPDIPLDVTFNEYLDIAKLYSTQRSSAYINGMLDTIVKKLKEEKKIKKTEPKKSKSSSKKK